MSSSVPFGNAGGQPPPGEFLEFSCIYAAYGYTIWISVIRIYIYSDADLDSIVLRLAPDDPRYHNSSMTLPQVE